MRNLLVIFFVLFFSSTPHASEPKSGFGSTGFGAVASGFAIDNSKELVSGFYHWINMAMPDRSYHADCVLFFSGQHVGRGKYKVLVVDTKSINQKPVKAELFFDGWSKFSQKSPLEQSFRLKLLGNIASCSDDVETTDSEFQISINEVGEWNKIVAINKSRSFFYSTPADSSKLKSYLVRGDLCFVLEENDLWLRVKYFGKNSETLGWIKKSDVYLFK